MFSDNKISLNGRQAPKRFEEMKTLLTEQITNTIPDPDQPFYAMCDASDFGIGEALLRSHKGTKK